MATLIVPIMAHSVQAADLIEPRLGQGFKFTMSINGEQVADIESTGNVDVNIESTGKKTIVKVGDEKGKTKTTVFTHKSKKGH